VDYFPGTGRLWKREFKSGKINNWNAKNEKIIEDRRIDCGAGERLNSN
jgi:hypothetical protein